MGRQVFEDLMLQALQQCDSGSIRLGSQTVGGIRFPGRVSRRYPTGATASLNLSGARVIGSYLSAGARLCHRWDLRIPPGRGADIATAHDLPPLRFPDEGELPRWFVEGNRKSLGIITPSKFAAEEMHELLDTRKTWVVPYGLSPNFSDPTAATAEELRRMNITGPFVVHAAGATLRKNLRGLAEAWRGLAPRIPHQLVLIGPDDSRRDELFRDLPRTRLVGRLAPAAVAPIMAASDAVVVPSIYEGFGLPALEGMACGVPVVASRRGALPEVCSDAAVMVEPEGEAIADGLFRAVSDDTLRRDLRTRGPRRAKTFSWAEAARSYLAVYREILEG